MPSLVDPKIDIIIVTYKSAATLDRCLVSLVSPLINQKIIIDNTTNNRGFAHAANLGAAKVTAPYILFLNPDAALTPHALERTTNYLEAHPEIAAAGFALRNKAEQWELNSFGPLPTLTNLFLRRFSKQALPVKSTLVGWVSGAALLIRRSVFEKIGGFDPDFFMYWEDVDLCYRLQKTGYRIALVPSAVVVHQRGAGLSDQAKKTALYDASADKYFRKHYATTIWILQRWLRRFYRFFSPLAP